jgi:DNA-binding IclR family transcriptional regulator
MTEDKDRLGIQSVEVAALVLRALIDGGRPLPLKEIARLSGMHPSKVHRYLVSLIRTELVEQDPGTGRYGVGPMAMALGLVGLRNVDVVRCASARLPALRDEIDETVLLALWGDPGPVVFELEESPRPVFMNIRVGSVLPLLQTATGRVFAAFLPFDRTRALIDAELAAARGRSAAPSRSSVENVLAETRTRRLARIAGDLVPGVAAMAAPVFDGKGRIAAVIGALGRTEEMDVAFDGAVAAALRRAAEEISRRLGYLPAPGETPS